MDNYRSDLDRDDRDQVKEDLARHRAEMSPEDRYRQDRAMHMINPENAKQQIDDIRWNHSLKGVKAVKADPNSFNEHGGY